MNTNRNCINFCVAHPYSEPEMHLALQQDIFKVSMSCKHLFLLPVCQATDPQHLTVVLILTE